MVHSKNTERISPNSFALFMFGMRFFFNFQPISWCLNQQLEGVKIFWRIFWWGEIRVLTQGGVDGCNSQYAGKWKTTNLIFVSMLMVQKSCITWSMYICIYIYLYNTLWKNENFLHINWLAEFLPSTVFNTTYRQDTQKSDHQAQFHISESPDDPKISQANVILSRHFLGWIVWGLSYQFLWQIYIKKNLPVLHHASFTACWFVHNMCFWLKWTDWKDIGPSRFLDQ